MTALCHDLAASPGSPPGTSSTASVGEWRRLARTRFRDVAGRRRRPRRRPGSPSDLARVGVVEAHGAVRPARPLGGGARHTLPAEALREQRPACRRGAAVSQAGSARSSRSPQARRRRTTPTRAHSSAGFPTQHSRALRRSRRPGSGYRSGIPTSSCLHGDSRRRSSRSASRRVLRGRRAAAPATLASCACSRRAGHIEHHRCLRAAPWARRARLARRATVNAVS